MQRGFLSRPVRRSVVAAVDAETDERLPRVSLRDNEKAVHERLSRVSLRDNEKAVHERLSCVSLQDNEEAADERTSSDAAETMQFDENEQVAHEPQDCFEFFLLFWAPSPRVVDEQAAAMAAYTPPEESNCRGGVSRGATRAALAPTTQWALSREHGDPYGDCSQPFVKMQEVPVELQVRVSAAGERTGLKAEVGGVYEAVLGAGFVCGLHVPALVSLSAADDSTFGPYVGLRRLDDFSLDLMRWAEPMGWHWQSDMNEHKGDPHPMLREPIADTLKTLGPDDDETRKSIRIDYVSGALGAGLDLQPQPVAGAVSSTTALCKSTPVPSMKPRVAPGVLQVLYFRVTVPHGQKLIFSDPTCVVCMAEESTYSNARCGHVCLCKVCYEGLQSAPCPLCRCADAGVVR